MNCDHIKEKISAHLDGEINNDELEMIQKHLKSCAACQKFAEQMNALNGKVLAQKPDGMPASVEKYILDKTIIKQNERIGFWNFLGGHYRVPRGLIWLGLLLLMVFSLERFALQDRHELQPAITIQPDETIMTVQKIVIDEDDIINYNSIDGKNPI